MVAIGLVLDLVGVFILVRDELGPLAARLRQHNEVRPEHWLDSYVIRLALSLGSSDARDSQAYVLETVRVRAVGFLCLFAGFCFQLAGTLCAN
jgi:hypothetical protein